MNYYLKVLLSYATFTGRARRAEYWYFCLVNAIVYVGCIIADELLGLEVLFALYWIAMRVPTLAVGFRRMHDVGMSGWYVLIPFYNLVLLVTDSDHDNMYGPNPKGDGHGAHHEVAGPGYDDTSNEDDRDFDSVPSDELASVIRKRRRRKRRKAPKTRSRFNPSGPGLIGGFGRVGVDLPTHGGIDATPNPLGTPFCSGLFFSCLWR